MKISQRRSAIIVAAASFIAARVSSIKAPQSQSHPIYFLHFFYFFNSILLLVFAKNWCLICALDMVINMCQVIFTITLDFI